MAQLSLADLTTAAGTSAEPTFVVAAIPKLGGVDPLGLRQTNFDFLSIRKTMRLKPATCLKSIAGFWRGLRM